MKDKEENVNILTEEQQMKRMGREYFDKLLNNFEER